MNTDFVLPEIDRPVWGAEAIGQVINRPEKAGWSVPKYGEQYQQPTGQYSIPSGMQTRDPRTLAFAIGWGYVG